LLALSVANHDGVEFGVVIDDHTTKLATDTWGFVTAKSSMMNVFTQAVPALITGTLCSALLRSLVQKVTLKPYGVMFINSSSSSFAVVSGFQ
jgi:hypothetical protein